MKVCKTCSGGCCRAFRVPITGFDILRIMRTIDIDPFFFCGVQEVKPEKLEKLLGKEPVFIFTDSGEPRYYEIFLKLILSKYYDLNHKCIFLHEWDAQEYGSAELEGIIGRCGIYDCRPLACRIYPSKLDDEGNLVMNNPYSEYTNPENKRWANLPYGLCPRPVQKEDYIHLTDEYIKNLTHQKFEMKFFLDLSKKWNENPDISDNFINFLEKNYSDRLLLNDLKTKK